MDSSARPTGATFLWDTSTMTWPEVQEMKRRVQRGDGCSADINTVAEMHRRRPRPPTLIVPRARARGAGRPRAQATRASARSGDSGDSDSDEPPPALAGPSPRFSRPWRRADDRFAELVAELDHLAEIEDLDARRDRRRLQLEIGEERVA